MTAFGRWFQPHSLTRKLFLASCPRSIWPTDDFPENQKKIIIKLSIWSVLPQLKCHRRKIKSKTIEKHFIHNVDCCRVYLRFQQIAEFEVNQRWWARKKHCIHRTGNCVLCLWFIYFFCLSVCLVFLFRQLLLCGTHWKKRRILYL